MTEERDTFLTRWSRRKLEERRAPDPRSPAENPVAREEPPEETAEPEATAEEIAALPKIEDLTPDTDITGFLRKGVPEVLRKAALRRMWSLDPAIRDYVSEAREYAYDWNVPGSIPGNGPLLPTDDVASMVERVFGGAERTVPVEVQPLTSSRTRDIPKQPPQEKSAGMATHLASQQKDDAADAGEHAVEGDRPQSGDIDCPQDSVPIRVAVPSQPDDPKPEAVPARRHGRARPV
jgi:hypothetical protein